MPKLFTTRQAAKKLGITAAALSRYVSTGKVFAPKIMEIGALKVHAWTEEDIERLRKLLPKIANGRKTWRAKKQLAISTQQSVKSKPKKDKRKKSKT